MTWSRWDAPGSRPERACGDVALSGRHHACGRYSSCDQADRCSSCNHGDASLSIRPPRPPHCRRAASRRLLVQPRPAPSRRRRYPASNPQPVAAALRCGHSPEARRDHCDVSQMIAVLCFAAQRSWPDGTHPLMGCQTVDLSKPPLGGVLHGATDQQVSRVNPQALWRAQYACAAPRRNLANSVTVRLRKLGLACRPRPFYALDFVPSQTAGPARIARYTGVPTGSTERTHEQVEVDEYASYNERGDEQSNDEHHGRALYVGSMNGNQISL